jgi:hypothetical protein
VPSILSYIYSVIAVYWCSKAQADAHRLLYKLIPSKRARRAFGHACMQNEGKAINSAGLLDLIRFVDSEQLWNSSKHFLLFKTIASSLAYPPEGLFICLTQNVEWSTWCTLNCVFLSLKVLPDIQVTTDFKDEAFFLPFITNFCTETLIKSYPKFYWLFFHMISPLPLKFTISNSHCFAGKHLLLIIHVLVYFLLLYYSTTEWVISKEKNYFS